MSLVPASKPQMKEADLRARMSAAGISEAVCVVGLRGYYRDSMGKPGVNDRGIYDDALFVIAPGLFASFNANTDPSAYRPGHGEGAAKGMACLKVGLYHAHRLGLHRGKYMALIQTGGPVTVIRDGTPPYEDSGHFGINIHHGSYTGTSSLGCQTIHPDQWAAFISMVQKAMHDNHVLTMPYWLQEA